MEEQVPLVVSHTFRVVSEEADMTGEGGEHTERVEKGEWEKRKRGKGGREETGKKRRKREMTVHVQKVQMSECIHALSKPQPTW